MLAFLYSFTLSLKGSFLCTSIKNIHPLRCGCNFLVIISGFPSRFPHSTLKSQFHIARSNQEMLGQSFQLYHCCLGLHHECQTICQGSAAKSGYLSGFSVNLRGLSKLATCQQLQNQPTFREIAAEEMTEIVQF